MITVFDLEADGLYNEATELHCWSALDIETDRQVSGRDWYDLQNILEESDTIVGHNILGFDLPLLRKLFEWSPLVNKTVGGIGLFDTMVVSQLLYPDLKSPEGWTGKPRPHSIEAWAMRFGGEQKVGIEDWSAFTPEMLERCEADVRITAKLYDYLKRKSDVSRVSYI